MSNPNFDNQIIEIRGDAYERGFQTGALLKKAIRRELKFSKDMYQQPDKRKLIQTIGDGLRENYAYIYREIQGRSDGAKVEFDHYLYFLLHEFENNRPAVHERCTSIMVSTEQNRILAHNEDGNYTADCLRIVKNVYENGNVFYEIADIDNLPSSTIMVREDYAWTMNYIAFDRFNLENLPTYFFLRVLCECRTIEAFFDTFQRIPITGACHLNVCDKKTKKLYSMEKVIDEVSVAEVKGVNIHANHFMHDAFIRYRPAFQPSYQNGDNSYNQQMVAEHLAGDRKDLNAKEVFDILTYYGACDFNSVLSKKNNGHHGLTMGTYLLDLNNDTNRLFLHNKHNDIVVF